MRKLQTLLLYILMLFVAACSKQHENISTYTVTRKNFENIIVIDGYGEPVQSTSIICLRASLLVRRVKCYGDIDSQSLALERNRMNTAYTSHLNAYINYQLSLADLMRKTFYDFRNQRLIE